MSVDVDLPSPEEAAEAPAPTPAKHRPRVFSPTFSGPGLLMAGLFFALSVQPSLLPRAGYVQGIASGITLMIGYGIGAGGQALWNYLQIPKLKGRARTIVSWILILLVSWSVLFSAWRQVGWQNEIRTLFGMEPVSWTTWPVIIGVAVAVSALILIVSRSLRLLFRTVFGWLGRQHPPTARDRPRRRRPAPALLAAHHRCPRQRLLRRCQRHVLEPRRRHVARHRAAGVGFALGQP